MTNPYMQRMYNTLVACCLSLVAIGIVLLSAGCEKVWTVANRGHLQRDMTALAQQVGVTLTAPDCHMVGMTRDGVCTFKTSSRQIAQLVQGLKLKSESANPLLETRCGSQDAFRAATRLYRYSVGGRPPELRLKDGSAFQFLSLLYNAGNQSACVALSYSDG